MTAALVATQIACSPNEVTAPVGWRGFAAPVAYPSGGTVLTGLTIADADGDGHLDVLTVARGELEVRVLPGTGAGTLDASTAYTGGSDPRRAVIGDVNGDGTGDLIVIGHFDNAFVVRLGTGGGQFGDAVTYPLRNHGRLVAVANLNGDAYDDVVVTHDGSGEPIYVSRYLGSASGAMIGGEDIATTLVTSRDIAIGDFDDDGNTDVAVGTGDADVGVLVFHGSGDGTLGDPLELSPISDVAGASDGLENLAVADVNGDGRDDLIGAHYESNRLSVRLSTGSTFAAAIEIPLTNALDVAAGDVDGDDVADAVAVQNDAGTVAVFRGTGTGSFFAPLVYDVGPGPVAVGLADFNDDGSLDVAVVDLADHRVRILLNRGRED